MMICSGEPEGAGPPAPRLLSPQGRNAPIFLRPPTRGSMTVEAAIFFTSDSKYLGVSAALISQSRLRQSLILVSPRTQGLVPERNKRRHSAASNCDVEYVLRLHHAISTK